MMRAFVFAVALAGLLGCTSGTGPSGDVSGEWVAVGLEFRMTLDLVQHGTTVGGTASTWGFINPPTHTYTIAGSYSRPSLTLTLTREDSLVSQLTALVQDSSHMTAARAVGSSSDSLRFVRQ